MAKEPEFKQIGASLYACTVCQNFKVEIVKPMNAGQLKKHLAARLSQHVKEYHLGKDFGQTTGLPRPGLRACQQKL